MTKDELVANVKKLYPHFKAEIKRNITYKNAPDGSPTMDIYYPLDVKKDKYPVFLSIHGGGWQTGSKEDPNGLFQDLLDKGVACVSINYRCVRMWRSSDKRLIRDCVTDCHDATIPVKHAYHAQKEAKKFGVPVELLLVENSWHGWSDMYKCNPSVAEINKITVDYVLKHVGVK